MPTNNIVAIIPCNDLDASEAFYRRLGFSRPDYEAASEGEDSYRMLADGKGAEIQLPLGVHADACDLQSIAMLALLPIQPR